MDKRMVLPLIFGLLVVAAIGAYAWLFLILPIPVVFKLLIGAVVVALTAAMIYVIIQRNQELKQEGQG